MSELFGFLLRLLVLTKPVCSSAAVVCNHHGPMLYSKRLVHGLCDQVP